jgi:streptogramin lyase
MVTTASKRKPGGRDMRRTSLVLFLLVQAGAVAMSQAGSGKFEELGIPIRQASLLGRVAGPAPGGGEALYMSFHQSSRVGFLLSVDPKTGESRRHVFPVKSEQGAWGISLGRDGRIYLGTHWNAHLLRFDPAKSILEDLGRPLDTEEFIWCLSTAPDGTIFGGTYPNCHLISYSPSTGRVKDYGRMDPRQQYLRSLAVDSDGFVYCGVGSEESHLIRCDPRSGEKRDLMPEEYRKTPGFPRPYVAEDGEVYFSGAGRWFVVEGGQAVEVSKEKVSPQPPQRFDDGSAVAGIAENEITVRAPSGETRKVAYKYTSEGSQIFVLEAGPDGRVYGSSIMPLRLFRFDPVTRKLEDLGNPMGTGGEIYSLLPHQGKLYMAAYGGADFAAYDPSKPWRPGKDRESNPRDFGSLGHGQDRPIAMAAGPDGAVYIGTIPGYGMLGGALSRYDPQTDEIQVYRNVVPNQSVVALAADEKTGLVCGGTGVGGGTGSFPTEKQAVLFLWDPATRAKVWEMKLEGSQSVQAMCSGGNGLVYAIVRGNLVVLDVGRRKIVHKTRFEPGRVVMNSFKRGPDGLIWGLTGKSIFSLDPSTRRVQEVTKYDGDISSGLAVADGQIYFGSGPVLMRWRR